VFAFGAMIAATVAFVMGRFHCYWENFFLTAGKMAKKDDFLSPSG